MRYAAKSWANSVELRLKSGKTRKLLDMTVDDMKDIDDTKDPLLFGEPKAAELILLGMSADAYPVAIEKRARQLRKLIENGR